MPNIGVWEIILILVVVLLLFGARKLPELARSVGRSMRIFKSEVKEMKDESPSENNQTHHAATERADEDFWNSPEAQPRQIQPQVPQQPQNYQQPHQQNQ